MNLLLDFEVCSFIVLLTTFIKFNEEAFDGITKY